MARRDASGGRSARRKPLPVGRWVEDEFASLCLGDARRTARFKFTISALAQAPQKSLPDALPGWAALKAAYGLLRSDSVDHASIIDAHVHASVCRASGLDVVLAVQDTTYIDFTSHPSVRGLGRLSKDWQRGLVVHSTLAISTERLPLGLFAQEVWTRDIDRAGTRNLRRQLSIEDKESNQWLTSLKVLDTLKQSLPDTRLVSVADRKADVFDLFNLPRQHGVDLLVRSAWNRALLDDQDEHAYLWELLEASKSLGHCEVHIPAKTDRAARTAKLNIRARAVRLKPPRARRASEGLKPIDMWAVLAREERPGKHEPLEWMLLTSLPTETLAQALERLDWYSARWGIEVWHRVLKTGCKIERLLLRKAEALVNALAMFSIIAWRVQFAAMLARDVPDAPCTLLLDDDQWQALYCRVHEVPIPCGDPPSLGQAVRWIAGLGGWIGRKNDRPPGAEVLWRGFQSPAAFTPMFRIMRKNL